MSWIDRLVENETGESNRATSYANSNMSPGLTGAYDWALREKAGMHKPPTPPECMGLEGEYDPNGLARRVAIAFDQDPSIDDIPTLEVSQEGGTIILKGEVSDQDMLDRLVKVASKVDGTKAVDTSRATVNSSPA